MTRTIAEQTEEQLGGPDGILARQRRDHREMTRLMDRYREAGPGDDGERALKDVVQLVFSHAFAEESVLWPAVRRSVPDGEELTSRVEEEHQQINDLFTDIERLAPGSPEREDRIARAFALVEQDIRDEEDLLLPRLQEAVDTPRQRRLGTAWEAVRKTAPTHPHPVVPRRPPGNAIAGVPLSVYDRARDALGRVPSTSAWRTLAVPGALLAAAVLVGAWRRRR